MKKGIAIVIDSVLVELMKSGTKHVTFTISETFYGRATASYKFTLGYDPKEKGDPSSDLKKMNDDELPMYIAEAILSSMDKLKEYAHKAAFELDGIRI